jgi:SRSO17 transposase
LVLAVAVVTTVDVTAWKRRFALLMATFGSLFVRPEPRSTACAYVRGLLSGVERKNSWWLAEAAGHAGPRAMQRLLTTACWDADAARDLVRAQVVDHLGPGGVLIFDETGFLKKGAQSVGVQRQYSGTAGRIENSQLAVFATYATDRGRGLIDRRLYLPKCWCDDAERRDEAGVPADVTFQTKPRLATDMLAAAIAADVPFSWVTADEAYGNNPAFRADLRDRSISYMVAVACNTRVRTALGTRRVDHLVAALPPNSWQSYSAGNGSKGPRNYHWAWVSLADTSPDRWLLVRRNPKTGELAFYLAWSPTRHPLPTLVRVAATRWAVEETFQAGKSQVGLDHYQVRGWIAWHRHITLCMLALAFLITIVATDTSAAHPAPNDPAGPRPFLPDPRVPIRLTLAEARHLLATLIIEPVSDALHILRWSTWRRLHQAAARAYHYKRRSVDP